MPNFRNNGISRAAVTLPSPKRRGLKTFVVAWLLLAALVPLLTACAPWTVKPINDEGSAQGQSAEPGKPGFSGKLYVDSIWQSKVLPTVQEKASDLQTVLAALKADPEAARQKYGYREGQGPYNFLVKGEAKVTSVDTTTRTGTLKLEVPGADPSQEVAIQIGPVVRGTALRDAMPFIQFNLFTNQLEYADVSNQLNDRVLKDVVGKVDTASLAGKIIEFQGAFAYSSSGTTLMIIPVKLAAK